MKAPAAAAQPSSPPAALPDRVGPWLTDDLLIDACRYNAGRCTGYAALFAQDLAATWAQLSSRCRQQIRRDLEQLFDRDDSARAHRAESAINYESLPLPLGHDSDRQAWEMVRQAWQRSDAAAAAAAE